MTIIDNGALGGPIAMLRNELAGCESKVAELEEKARLCQAWAAEERERAEQFRDALRRLGVTPDSAETGPERPAPDEEARP